MRVLHVIPSLSPVHGGPTSAVATMEAALAAAGVSVTTLTTDDDGPGRRFSPAFLPAPAMGVRRVFMRKWADAYQPAPGMARWLWSHVRDFDVVHIHALFSFASACAALVAAQRGVPYILRPLGTLAPYGIATRRPWLKAASMALLEGPMLRRAAAVHFTSRKERDEAMRLGMAFRAEIVPLAIEDPVAVRRRDTASIRVLFLSRIEPVKNPDGLLRGFAAVARDRPAMGLVMAGGGRPEYVTALQALAAALGIAGKVEWTGHVEGPRKARLLGSADIFALPSHSESFGLAAAEAMAAGLPCLLGRGVAIAADAERAGAALLCDPQPESIAAGLRRLADDAGLREATGAAARAHAGSAYSAEAMARNLIALYSRIAARP